MLDLILGDPETWNHPVRRIGNLIQKLTDFFLKRGDGISDSAVRARAKRKYGRLLVAAVLLISGGGTALLLVGAYTLHPWAGCALEGWLTYRLLAARNLRDASMRVCRALQSGSLKDSRYAVSMIVGRDTTVLDETGVTKAAVETVAENTSDGVIAPMLYMALGGPVLGMMYKAVNTMDSMVGYRNDKYMDFGRAAARLDDGVNFIPARISGLLMVAVAFLMGFLDRLRGLEQIYSGRRAFRIFLRDRRKHASPNAAHTEAACAGALGVQLAGNARYFGRVVEKPTLGENLRPVVPADILRVNRLMLGTAVLCECICLGTIGLLL